MGHAVVAVEPTAELRAHGQRLHRASRIKWIDDSLPDLERVHAYVQARGECFDLIMLKGVWMHLDASEREHGMGRVADLLRRGGLMILQFRHGPAPPARRVFEVTVAETCTLAARHGLTRIRESERPALLSGSAVRWSALALGTQR